MYQIWPPKLQSWKNTLIGDDKYKDKVDIIDQKIKEVNKRIEDLKPTHRYLFFQGSRQQKKQMLKDLKMEILPYPKGQNQNYECVDIDMWCHRDLFI